MRSESIDLTEFSKLIWVVGNIDGLRPFVRVQLNNYDNSGWALIDFSFSTELARDEFVNGLWTLEAIVRGESPNSSVIASLKESRKVQQVDLEKQISNLLIERLNPSRRVGGTKELLFADATELSVDIVSLLTEKLHEQVQSSETVN